MIVERKSDLRITFVSRAVADFRALSYQNTKNLMLGIKLEYAASPGITYT